MMKPCRYYVPETESEAAFEGEGLSFDEEIELSKKILAGEAAKCEISENDSLKEKLGQIILDGEQAYERLVLANAPRAMKIAASTWKKNPFGLNDIDDYRQTAMKVICVCARTYDWQMGCRFGTYVHRSLQNEMMRENARSGYAIRIPEEDLCRLNAVKRQKEADHFAGLDEKERNSANRLLSACSVSKSLEEPVNSEDADTEFGETLADPEAVSAEMIEKEIFDHLQIMKLQEALAALPEEERNLLKGRMGFDGDPQPLKAFVGVYAQSISGVQKKLQKAEKHLREIFNSLPEGRLDGFINVFREQDTENIGRSLCRPPVVFEPLLCSAL